ncbi:MAG: NAAT family transporter [Bdellovibrionales bacterium]|nr:NAAT family transporter [Bdellovibrionales bacterium]
MWSNSFFLVAFPAIFTIVNPLGAVGPFLAMTGRDDWSKRASTAQRACAVACAVLLVCTAVGTFMFNFFGFTLPALKIAGGVLLFGVGIDMINARQSRSKATEEEREEGALKEDIAIFPLGIPLLSGPGSMVTVFILGDRAKTNGEHAFIYLSIVLTMLISYVVLTQGARIARAVGATGMNVMSRLMGLILASIAVQFMLDGLLLALPGLGHAG